MWLGRPMSLILDHINGVSDDNRLENLRIVCPNCAATLDTHCGRRNRHWPSSRSRALCVVCRSYRALGVSVTARDAVALAHPPGMTRVRKREERLPRPSHAQLVREVHAIGFSATGRRYGVSDNAVRKWLRQYEREAQISEAA